MLEFVGDAISLSGSAGTKLKSDLLGEYYSFWWNITSGGPSKQYEYNTVIVELHAGTGEIYVKDINKTILGSAGHALELKSGKGPITHNLKIILIEENEECRNHLKQVIKRRWTNIPVDRIEGPWAGDTSKKVYLLKYLDKALDIVKDIRGNAIYFFDPLRSVDWTSVSKVARSRLRSFYQTGTEFIIFLFTSDWFLGRDDFAPLPKHNEESKWTPNEKITVRNADELFGDTHWREAILNELPINIRQCSLLNLYKSKLREWFRYVLLLPFNPKGDQIYHLIMCSNYDVGVRMNRDFYSTITNNERYKPNNSVAFKIFKSIHPDIFSGISGNSRPLQWLILWKIITQHEDGIADLECTDIKKVADFDVKKIQLSLDWLKDKKYVDICSKTNNWNHPVIQYSLNWQILKGRLRIDPPDEFIPISPVNLKIARPEFFK